MTAESTATSDTSAALDSSAATGTLDGNSAQRINDLMSKWQTAQAEATRLQQILTTTVAENAELRQNLTAATDTNQTAVTDVTAQLATANTTIASLQAEIATLQQDNKRFSVLIANPDLSSYADILPRTSDETELNRAVATIRAARDADRDRSRSSQGSNPPGGQPPRRGSTAMTPVQIRSYLDSAPPGQFEIRLKEVTGT